ncbi:hypothetical protein AXX12_00680 [Anaerosporomusa subterranea]|uniref:Uncharacterized protein n=1 Tax=Anaerosporomusa subterranea TaxID=1794912 RepID=A0A154BVN6_ANASB|nr:spore germination protein [Anaerosporomusa subterranea]KYZ78094.1 hypothetical protein AXX12_00680 [Anaerosporomusa subterranea]
MFDKCKAEKLSAKLRDLKSLITHAQDIEQETESIVGSLRDPYVNPGAYQISSELEANLTHMKEIFAGSDDIITRQFLVTALNRRAAIVFTESMADTVTITNHIIEKLTLTPLTGFVPCMENACDIGFLKDTLLTAAAFTEEDNMKQVVKKILSGHTALWIDGSPTALVVSTRKVESRSISDPISESDVRGPRDGFTEELRVNLTLLRRRLLSPNLVAQRLEVGARSQTDVAVIYFRGIANYKLVHEVEKRIKRLNVDMPVGGNEIQSMIEDHPYSPFPTILATERPDKLLASLMEGKVGILVNGSPFALVTPTTLADFFQAGDDYYEKWLSASLIRFARYIAAFFAMTLPALYVAITTFHPGLIPTPLTLTIAMSRMGVPLPAFLEALIMELMLEVMQEAGVRLPKSIGPAVSIAGSLVIGEAAVNAGLVGSPMVIVTAFTAVASFIIANYRLSLTIRVFRIPLMVLSATLGMFGFMLGVIAILVHLSLLESFGEPYLAPFAPRNLHRLSDLKDTLVVAPPSATGERPDYLETLDGRKQQKK